jgi:GxxExxY protein
MKVEEMKGFVGKDCLPRPFWLTDAGKNHFCQTLSGSQSLQLQKTECGSRRKIAVSATCSASVPLQARDVMARRLHLWMFMLHSTPLARKVIGCAIEVHKALGPGLLESAYEECLAHEMSLNSLRFMRGAPLPILYKGIELDCSYRLDFLVEDELLLELKSVEQLHPVHYAQVKTYLKLLNVHQGLLINFNARRLSEGLKSVLHGPPTPEGNVTKQALD